jgi:hypothetical protein
MGEMTEAQPIRFLGLEGASQGAEKVAVLKGRGFSRAVSNLLTTRL